MKRLRLAIILIAVATSGVIARIAYRVHTSERNSSAQPLVCEPSAITLARDPLETEKVTVNLQLKNTSEETTTITEAVASCGCTDLVTTGGIPFDSPIELRPGEVMPWQATIDTTYRIGSQVIYVSFSGKSKGREVSAQSAIRFFVRSGWRVRPQQLSFTELSSADTAKATIDVYDAYPDPGIRIKRIVTSHPNLRVSLRTPGTDSTEFLHFRGHALKKRYEVRLSYRPDFRFGSTHEFITLIPSNKHQRAIEIPIIAHDPRGSGRGTESEGRGGRE